MDFLVKRWTSSSQISFIWLFNDEEGADVILEFLEIIY